MDPRLITLKLVLDEVGVGDNIATVSDRKKLQKAIYLAQIAGADLGYRFAWYLMGPYSPALTRDYYGLAEALARGDDVYKEYTLRDDWQPRLTLIRELLSRKPSGLENVSWLELLASVDYLRRVRKLDDDSIEPVLRDKKPRLAGHIEAALQALNGSALNTA